MMSGESLAKVFGPTIVGHASPDPEPATIWHDTQRQPKVHMCGTYVRTYVHISYLQIRMCVHIHVNSMY